MDQRWFMTFGVLLICAIYILIGTEQQQSRFGLWLDRHSSPEVAEANALRPLIKCINLVDVPWRLDRAATPSKEPDDFPYMQRYDFDAIQRDICKSGIAFKAGFVDSTQQIGLIADHYTSTLRNMLERYEALQRNYSPDATLALTRHDKDYTRRIEAFLPASEALRRALESLELGLRPKQLEQLEQRQGRDLHWYLLNYMIRARGTVDQLTEAANSKKLDFSAVGTGGTLAGVALALKERNPKIRIYLADPMGSAIYSHYARGELKAEGNSITEGIGQGRITRNLEGAPLEAGSR